jgi:hypothetical protein
MFLCFLWMLDLSHIHELRLRRACFVFLGFCLHGVKDAVVAVDGRLGNSVHFWAISELWRYHCYHGREIIPFLKARRACMALYGSFGNLGSGNLKRYHDGILLVFDTWYIGCTFSCISKGKDCGI